MHTVSFGISSLLKECLSRYLDSYERSLKAMLAKRYFQDLQKTEIVTVSALSPFFLGGCNRFFRLTSSILFIKRWLETAAKRTLCKEWAGSNASSIGFRQSWSDFTFFWVSGWCASWQRKQCIGYNVFKLHVNLACVFSRRWVESFCTNKFSFELDQKIKDFKLKVEKGFWKLSNFRNGHEEKEYARPYCW